MTEFRSISLVAMGGNLPSEVGSPQYTLAAAVAELSKLGLQVRAISRFFHTPCFPAGAGPDYVNAVIEVASTLSPVEILAQLHAVETRFARVRDQRWGMRTLDLDLIAVADQILPDRETIVKWQGLPLEEQMRLAPDQLVLPHPRVQDRAFVLVPLCDIAPNWQHPVLGHSAAQMLAALPEADITDVKPL